MASSMEFLKLNGATIRLTGSYLRLIPQDDGGPPLQEFELVIILRGTMDHRAFLGILGRGQIKVEIPDKTNNVWQSFDTEVISAYSNNSGAGEASAYRHDVVLRETPASAERRAAAQPAPTPTPPPTPVAPPQPEPDEDPNTPLDLSSVKVGGNTHAWATALRQMTNPGAKPAAPETPLDTSELAGAEAVLVGLHLEALIEQLAAAGIVRRSSVNTSFMRLVQQRFVAEATPVIGVKAAKQAAKAALEDE
jgi:hypothetical protein